MIPYILAAAGGYLIGDSLKGKEFAKGGMMALIEDEEYDPNESSGLNTHIPMLSFSKNDYDVNVNTENLQVDVNIKERDSVDYSGLSETGSDLQQLDWGYAIYPKNVDELYKVLKVLRVNVSYDRLKKYLAASGRYLIGLPPEGIMEKGGVAGKPAKLGKQTELGEGGRQNSPFKSVKEYLKWERNRHKNVQNLIKEGKDNEAIDGFYFDMYTDDGEKYVKKELKKFFANIPRKADSYFPIVPKFSKLISNIEKKHSEINDSEPYGYVMFFVEEKLKNSGFRKEAADFSYVFR